MDKFLTEDEAMSICKICKKMLRENPTKYLSQNAPYGFKVLSKTGNLSFKCSCNCCGHVWIARSDQAKFQFEEPQQFAQQQKKLHRILAKIQLKEKRGGAVFIYPKKYFFG